MKKIIFIIIVFCLLLSCATAKFILTGDKYPPYEGTVKVFFEEPIDLKYDEIGIISSTGGMAHEWTHLIEAMQIEAAKFGANAIIIIKENTDELKIISGNQYGLYGSSASMKSLTSKAVFIKE
jgi:uncharacterized protein YbjQ (UPF0145 family)